MAFFISPSLFAKTPTIFFVIQGDQHYPTISQVGGKQVVKERLQYEILDEIKDQVRGNSTLNALIFFDSLESLPVLEIYEAGRLLSFETLPEDFTNPAVLATVFERGYDLFPNTAPILFHWGYTLPIHPQHHFDLSHPDHFFDIEVLREALDLAQVYQGPRKMEAIILSTCFNSSLEILYALNSYTKRILATEIYLFHRGFSSAPLFKGQGNDLDLWMRGLLENILADLRGSIPIGPASGKPVLDSSLTLLKTASVWDFHDYLSKLFYDLIDVLENRETYPILRRAFKMAYLHQEGLFDLKVFIEELETLLPPEDVHQFNDLFSKIIDRHEGREGTRGLNFTIPIEEYQMLLSLNETMKRSYLRGTALYDFLQAIEKNFFEIFGVDLSRPFPVRYQGLSAYFPDGHIPSQVAQALHDALHSNEPDVIIAPELEIEMNGRLEDQGKFIGRLGTHRLMPNGGREIYLRSRTVLLNSFISEDRSRRYRLRGHLVLSKKAWSSVRDVLLEVQDLTILKTSSR